MKKLEMLPRLNGGTKSRMATSEEIRKWAKEDFDRLVEVFGKKS